MSSEEEGEARDRAELVATGLEAIAAFTEQRDEAVASVVAYVRGLTGETIAVRRPGVQDAAYADLARMESQAKHYLEAMRLVRQWMLPSDPRRLGDLLKVVPADVAEEISSRLRAAGVWPRS